MCQMLNIEIVISHVFENYTRKLYFFHVILPKHPAFHNSHLMSRRNQHPYKSSAIEIYGRCRLLLA